MLSKGKKTHAEREEASSTGSFNLFNARLYFIIDNILMRLSRIAFVLLSNFQIEIICAHCSRFLSDNSHLNVNELGFKSFKPGKIH